MLCIVDERRTAVGADRHERRIVLIPERRAQVQVFAIPTAEIGTDRTWRKGREKLGDQRPRLVARARKVRGNHIVYPA